MTRWMILLVFLCTGVTLLAQDSVANGSPQSIELRDGTLLFDFSSLGENESSKTSELGASDSARVVFLLHRAQMEIAEDHVLKGKRFLTKALRIDKHNGAALRNLGDLYAFKGKHKKAVEYYKKSIEELDSSASAYYNLGQTYMRMERCQDALECFTTLRKLPGAPENTLMSLAQANGACGYLNAALENLNDYLEYDPTSLPELRYRAQIFMEIGFYADALNDLNVYLAAVDDAKSFYLRGLAKMYGKIELIEACDDFIKARSLGSYEAERALKQYCK